MLEHQKKVLLGVAKNPFLFRKEVAKSLTWLNENEISELSNWIKERFGLYYMQIFNEVSYA